jgi:hypothetical protein
MNRHLDPCSGLLKKTPLRHARTERRRNTTAEWIEKTGAETVISEDKHFRPEEAEDSGETARTPDAPPQKNPRRHSRPQFTTTAA